MSNSASVLLVDDESLFAQSVTDALEGAIPLLQVERARNGRQALEAIEQRKFDLLITDLQMPEIGGFELLVTLNERGVHLPTIVVTAHGEALGSEFARSYGAFAFVHKPVDVGALVRLVSDRLAAPGGGGRIDGVSVPGFLQLLEMERKTCTVRVSSGAESAALTFVKGSLVDARASTARGDEAVIEMLAWRDPLLHLEPTTGLVEETIQTPLGHLLMEAMRLIDEQATRAPPRRRTRSAILRELPALPPLRSEDRSESSLAAWTSNESSNATPEKESKRVANVNDSLDQVMAIDGALGAALVDYESGLTLGTAGGGKIDIETAATGNTQVVRAKMEVMRQLGIPGGIEDMLITLQDQIHIIRPLESIPNLFLYLAFDRQRGNLGMARMKLKQIEQGLEV